MAGKKQVTSPAKIKLKISEEQLFGRNANIVCDAKKDLINRIKDCITSSKATIGICHRDKKNTKKDPNAQIGINSDSLNAVIREKLKSIESLCFETNVEYGAFFERKKKSDFDFSLYDRMYNYCSFWNYNNKRSDLKKIIKETIQDRDKSDWNRFKKEYKPKNNTDVVYRGENCLNIVGEIQMGNWGLLYKDIFRLLRAKKSPGVELYIYVTITGFLKDKLSSSVVCFEKAVKEFKELMDIIEVPVLVLGVDIDTYDLNEFKSAHRIVQQAQQA